MPKQLSLYFKVHQPWRLRHPEHLLHHPSDDPRDRYFEHDGKDAEIFHRVAKKNYYPANHVLLEAMDELADQGIDLKLAFSLSGTFIDQAERFDPGVLDSFRALVDTGNVEILGETYYHSLAALFEDHAEFRTQVRMHRDRVNDAFGVDPSVFVNTEALHNDRVAATVRDMGFDAVMTEGVDHHLGWRSPNHVYRAPNGIPVLLRNYRLSDDIGYRFSNTGWDEWPLTADTFASWLNAADGDVVNLFMDYETFGEHHWPDTGILSFLRHLPGEVANHDDPVFATPSEIVERQEPVGDFSVDPLETISWADMERDTSAWLGNWMQQLLFRELERMAPRVRAADEPVQEAWRRLTTSDHLYYLCDKGAGDGDVHSYFSRFDSIQDGFLAYTSALADIRQHL